MDGNTAHPGTAADGAARAGTAAANPLGLVAERGPSRMARYHSPAPSASNAPITGRPGCSLSESAVSGSTGCVT